jgi:hypothetical protein
MLFSATVVLLFGAAFAQSPVDQGFQNAPGAGGQGNNVQLPDFVSNFLQGLNRGQLAPQGGQRQGGIVPPVQVQAPNRAPQPPPPNPIPISTSSLPNVFGPLAANWSACPAGFDCCHTGVYADPYQQYECCGDGSFDRRYQKCEQGQIVPLTPTGPIGSATTRLTRLNCGGYLYVAAESYRCCNFDVFDPTSQQCQDGQITTLPAPSQPSLPYGSVYAVCGNYRYVLASGATLTWGCCGQDLYNYNTENCTTQGIVPQRTPDIQSQVPAAQGLLVFCSGTRYWVDPNALSTIRCCGARLCSAMYQPAMVPQSSPLVGSMGGFQSGGQ